MTPVLDRVVVDANGCHIWQGITKSRYAHVSVGGVTKTAHRHAYELAKGPIPDGLVIDHLCRQPWCVNPEHLEAVTQGENVRRGRSGWHTRARTHCPSGHEYNETNTYFDQGKGERRCRPCMNAQQRAYRQRRREAVR